jgi:hypothetical protein
MNDTQASPEQNSLTRANAMTIVRNPLSPEAAP